MRREWREKALTKNLGRDLTRIGRLRTGRGRLGASGCAAAPCDCASCGLREPRGEGPRRIGDAGPGGCSSAAGDGVRRGAGESGTGPPEAGAEQPRRRAPPLAERSRGLARGADVLVLAGTWKGFFFHNLLVGLGLGYAKPYPCSPLAKPVMCRIMPPEIGFQMRTSVKNMCGARYTSVWLGRSILYFYESIKAS